MSVLTLWWCCAPRKTLLEAFSLGDSIAFPAPKAHWESAGCCIIVLVPNTQSSVWCVPGWCSGKYQPGETWNETILECLDSAWSGNDSAWKDSSLWGWCVKGLLNSQATRAAPAPLAHTQVSMVQAGQQEMLAFSWILEFVRWRTWENTSISVLEDMYLRQQVMTSIILTLTPWDGKICLRNKFGKSLQAKSYC